MSRDGVAGTRRFWEDAFNGRDLSALGELIADDYLNHAALPGTPPGPAGQAAVLERLWTALPDAHFAIEHVAVDGDVVICTGTMSGTHEGELLGVPASGRRVAWRMCHVMKFGPDGRAIEHSAIRDDLGLMRQMGGDMSDREPELAAFDALIGTWATEATHPMHDGVVRGSVVFEWLEGGRFLIQRSRNEHELFPDAICVIGAPERGDGPVMEYFDSRGVRRTYGIALEAGVLRMWRDHPGFDQRYSATLDRDGFEGLWQIARSPGEWEDDLRVRYRRRD